MVYSDALSAQTNPNSSPTLTQHSSGNSDSCGFEVEEILELRISANGDIEYFVKWDGFGDSENIWVPAATLSKLRNQKALAEFRARQNPDMECKNTNALDVQRVNGTGM
jgi:hypothetical protein